MFVQDFSWSMLFTSHSDRPCLSRLAERLELYALFKRLNTEKDSKSCQAKNESMSCEKLGNPLKKCPEVGEL